MPAHCAGVATPGPARFMRSSLAAPSAIHCARTAWAASADRVGMGLATDMGDLVGVSAATSSAAH